MGGQPASKQASIRRGSLVTVDGEERLGVGESGNSCELSVSV